MKSSDLWGNDYLMKVNDNAQINDKWLNYRKSTLRKAMLATKRLERRIARSDSLKFTSGIIENFM